MLNQIKGLHHVTSLASSARENNAFFTGPLGLRRVKKTVNFDAPEIYHLYYGDEAGTPGSAMTYFPFPNAARGRPGAGEVERTAFSVPEGSLDAWADRLSGYGVEEQHKDAWFGETRLTFRGPDGDGFALIETDDARRPWTGGGVGERMAIRGFHSVAMRLSDATGTVEILKLMGYREVDRHGHAVRFAVQGGNGADVVDVETATDVPQARQGAGSVHHVAFAVETRAHQLEVREALVDAGWQVSPVIDRDYFLSIYLRTPGGVLFEVATNEPGFTRDEDIARLGEALMLPSQHAHLRAQLERSLEPLEG